MPKTNRTEITLADKEFEFTTVTFDDPRVTAAQVAMAVGKHPVEDHVVLVLTKTGELETLRRRRRPSWRRTAAPCCSWSRAT